MTTPIYGLPPGIDAQQFQQFQAWMAMQQQQQSMQQPFGIQTQMPSQSTTSQQGIPQQISQPSMTQVMSQPSMQQQSMQQQPIYANTNPIMATQPVGGIPQQMPYATYQQVPMAQFGTMQPQMMMPGYVQPGQFMPGFSPMPMQQIQSQPQPPSKVPKTMLDVLNWITTVATDWERKVFQDKKMKPDQLMQTMFDLKDKWNAYFAEYKKNKELGADTEFKALLDAAAEKTVLLIERLRARKKKLQPFMNSTRLKELSLDIDKMVDYDANKRAKIVNNMNIRLEDNTEVVKKNDSRTVL